jgi:hypothetical protein
MIESRVDGQDMQHARKLRMHWIEWRNLKEGREQLRGSKYKQKNIINHIPPPSGCRVAFRG